MGTVYHRSGDHRVLSVRSPAKVNLYLEVLGRRSDRFHEIDTLMQAISLSDELVFEREADGQVQLTVSSDDGQDCPPATEDNLVLRAARAAMAEAGRRGMMDRITGVSIRLHKRIPMGAGLGGGSSNAAWTLLGLNRLWNLNLDVEALGHLAEGLGSDVKFFLYGGLARCQGRGERVSPIGESIVVGTFHYVLAKPALGLSTALIYKELGSSTPLGKPLTIPKSLTTMNFDAIWSALRAGELFGNRLQEVAFRVLPELREVFDLFARAPFQIAQLTGSGSTLFGLCRDAEDAEAIAGHLREEFGRRAGPSREGGGTRVWVARSVPSWLADALS